MKSILYDQSNAESHITEDKRKEVVELSHVPEKWLTERILMKLGRYFRMLDGIAIR